MYNIDFNKLFGFNTPDILWKRKGLFWLKLLVNEVKTLYDDFIAWKNAIIYSAAHSGQVISIEHVLNDIFDPIYRRIYIDDGSRVLENFIYNSAEAQEGLYVFNNSETANPQVYLFNNQEDIDSNYDFKVLVPLSLIYNQNRMKAELNIHKPAGKVYKIIGY